MCVACGVTGCRDAGCGRGQRETGAHVGEQHAMQWNAAMAWDVWLLRTLLTGMSQYGGTSAVTMPRTGA
eukprot:COSAG02_NODE_6790_length_3359_cov_9.167178_2_plen_69_part_00